MNEHILRGFKDGIHKQASIGMLAKYLGGYGLVGAGAGVGMEYLDKESPDYRKAILRGALKGTLVGAAHYGLKKEIEDMVAQVLKGRAQAGEMAAEGIF